MGEFIKGIIQVLIKPLLNERGEIGTEDFTPEELVTLGEAEPEESAEEETEDTGESEDETSETEQAAEEEESDSATDEEEGEGGGQDDEELTPEQKRINKLTFEKNESKRKFDLFKTLGPEEYYKQFPDEKPKTEEEQAAEEKKTVAPSFGDAANLVVQGGQYDGKTLAEVHAENPIAATDLYLSYRDGLVDDQRKAEAEADRLQREAEEDITNFTGKLSKELFESDYGDLKDEDKKAVDKVLDQVMGFIDDSKNGTTNLDVAYFYLNKDKLLSEAAKNGAKGLTDQLKKGSTPSVKAGGDGGKTSGYDVYMELSPAQLAMKMDNMSEKESIDFINKAPQKIKEKFPQVDWDPI